jgi:hypothetical protein
MLEPDIARKCLAALIAVLLLVGVSVFASWWLAAPGPDPVEIPASPPPPSVPPSPENPPAAPTPLAWRSAIAPEALMDAEPAVSGPERERLERRAFELEMDNARLRGRLDDMLNWIIDNVRGTFPLPEGQMAHLRLVPVDEDMGVSADLAELLRLDDDEVDRLDSAFLGTRSVLWDLEAEVILVENPSQNQVVLNIPPYSQEGEYVREALYDELQQTLGAARFLRFLQVAERGLEEKFEYFGAVDRLLQFETVRDDASGDTQLFVRDERVIPNRDDPLQLDIIASERILTELPEEYLPYWNWLPEDVTRFSGGNP